MSLSRFFIDRPVFAWVIAVVVMLAGGIAAFSLPIEQYPNIAPPAVVITAIYPGADSESLQNSVTQVIEQRKPLVVREVQPREAGDVEHLFAGDRHCESILPERRRAPAGARREPYPRPSYATALTFAAWAPFGPCTTSNATFWPSVRDL